MKFGEGLTFTMLQQPLKVIIWKTIIPIINPLNTKGDVEFKSLLYVICVPVVHVRFSIHVKLLELRRS